MLQRFYAQLPDFARPNHPLMRYALLREGRRLTRRTQLMRTGLAILLLLLLVVPGWQIATQLGQNSVDAANIIGKIYLVLYWPLVIVQLIARLFAISSTSGVIANEVQHGTWNKLNV